MSPSSAAHEGFTALKAEISRHAFVFVEVVLDGVKTRAPIDTGARRTFGNRALARALGDKDDDPRPSDAEPLAGCAGWRSITRKESFSAGPRRPP